MSDPTDNAQSPTEQALAWVTARLAEQVDQSEPPSRGEELLRRIQQSLIESQRLETYLRDECGIEPGPDEEYVWTPPPITEPQQALLDQIAAAFQGVTLGDGVSLHETEVVDMYGSPEERQAARAPDEKHDWRKLVDDPELWRVDGVGGLSFYDAPGLRFHLPAYLWCWVRDPDGFPVGESLKYHLTSVVRDEDSSQMRQHREERLSLLTPIQRRCVRDVLLYVSAEMKRWYQEAMDEQDLATYINDFDQALERYWLTA